MRRIRVNELTPGMVLARPLHYTRGVLLHKNTPLTSGQISRLPKWHIDDVFVFAK